MIIEAATKIAEKLIDLTVERGKNHRSFYEDFVAPVYSEVQSIQSEYLDQFAQYREILHESQAPFGGGHPLAIRLTNDIQRSAPSRAELHALLTLLYMETETGDTPLTRFRMSTAGYLRTVVGAVDLDDIEPISQAPRTSLRDLIMSSDVTGLTRKPRYSRHPVEPVDLQAAALILLESYSEILNHDFGRVSTTHAVLKRHLLRP